jgi:hypothetical protein
MSTSVGDSVSIHAFMAEKAISIKKTQEAGFVNRFACRAR